MSTTSEDAGTCTHCDGEGVYWPTPFVVFQCDNGHRVLKVAQSGVMMRVWLGIALLVVSLGIAGALLIHPMLGLIVVVGIVMLNEAGYQARWW